MVGKYTELKDDKVCNVVLADAKTAQARGWVKNKGEAIGDMWDGQKFVPAPFHAQPAKSQDRTDAVIAALIKKGVITESDLKAL